MRGEYSTFRTLHIQDVMKTKTWWTRAEISYAVNHTQKAAPSSIYRTLARLLKSGVLSECICITPWNQKVRLLKWEGVKK